MREKKLMKCRSVTGASCWGEKKVPQKKYFGAKRRTGSEGGDNAVPGTGRRAEHSRRLGIGNEPNRARTRGPVAYASKRSDPWGKMESPLLLSPKMGDYRDLSLQKKD